jgi:hypothetical protein
MKSETQSSEILFLILVPTSRKQDPSLKNKQITFVYSSSN